MLSRFYNTQNYLSERKKDCFEGWYFRHTGEFPFSFIAGVSKCRGDSHAFIQYIDCESSYSFRFPLSSFTFLKENMSIKIENNTFSLNGINVRLFGDENNKNNGGDNKNGGVNDKSGKINYPAENGNKIRIECNLDYGTAELYKKSLLAPSVMGPFTYLPMPCSHAIISLNHKVGGTLTKNGVKHTITAAGYIEKDYGRKFPQNYVWVHAANNDVSIAAAAASPVVLGKLGFFCLINYKGQQYNFSLYKLARLKLTKEILSENKNHSSDNPISMVFKKGRSRLMITAQTGGCKQKLLAPATGGGMIREIYEDLWAHFSGSLVLNGEKIDISDITRCAFETAGNIV